MASPTSDAQPAQLTEHAADAAFREWYEASLPHVYRYLYNRCGRRPGQWWIPLDERPTADANRGRLVQIDVATATVARSVEVPLTPGRSGANALVAGDALWLLLWHVDSATGKEERSLLRLTAEDLGVTCR